MILESVPVLLHYQWAPLLSVLPVRAEFVLVVVAPEKYNALTIKPLLEHPYFHYKNMPNLSHGLLYQKNSNDNIDIFHILQLMPHYLLTTVPSFITFEGDIVIKVGLDPPAPDEIFTCLFNTDEAGTSL